MNRRVLGVLVHAAAGFIAGCTPTTPQPSSGAGAPSPTFLLSGKVADAAIVPIPGALVTIVGAGGTESSTLTDGGGRYELRGLPGGAVTVRASKEGYVASTNNLELPRTSPLDFVLPYTGPSFNLAGNYTVTFTADAACTQLPSATRTRTYSALIASVALNEYVVMLSGGRFHKNLFTASVAGRSAGFSTAPDGNEAVVNERLTDSTSVWIDFFASAAVDAPSVSVPMFANYAYCPDDVLPSGFQCRVPRITCTSSNHRFTLTRH